MFFYFSARLTIQKENNNVSALPCQELRKNIFLHLLPFILIFVVKMKEEKVKTISKFSFFLCFPVLRLEERMKKSFFKKNISSLRVSLLKTFSRTSYLNFPCFFE